jgi:hypothetical protein
VHDNDKSLNLQDNKGGPEVRVILFVPPLEVELRASDNAMRVGLQAHCTAPTSEGGTIVVVMRIVMVAWTLQIGS